MIIFFSSRRRHTRWPRDWSSDVCSSDLDSHRRPPHSPPGRGAAGGPRPGRGSGGRRSEERRVGKERRMRGVKMQIHKNGMNTRSMLLWYHGNKMTTDTIHTMLVRHLLVD